MFDGVHCGHAEVIRRVIAEARRRAAHAAVVTFDRHPGAVLSHGPQPAITSPAHRLRLFRALGVETCVVVRFDEAVAAIEAEDFARQVFAELLRAELLVLGFDCRFGRGRRGDLALCRRLGPELGFEVETVEPVLVDGRPVSSTAIRQAVLGGDFERAARLLGRAFSLYGDVVRGDERGHDLGYPTANLDPHNETIPPDGVYACWVFTDGVPLPGVCSVGRQPTFHPEGDRGRVVEVHLIGRRDDLYGGSMEVQFVGRLRGQEVFDGAEQLRAQIARDIEQARRILQEAAERG